MPYTHGMAMDGLKGKHSSCLLSVLLSETFTENRKLFLGAHKIINSKNEHKAQGTRQWQKAGKEHTAYT